MRTLCNIIRDLLPLYAEGITSADTVFFVEEHLKDCAECRAALDGMKTPSDAEKAASDLPDSDAMPLRTLRRKWQRKQAVLVCLTLITATAVFCCGLFAAEHFLYQERIMVNGAIYTQTDDAVTELPAGSVEIGYLRGISHRSRGYPIGNFMATNLDETYGGCPIYQIEDSDKMIYLKDYSRSYIPFVFTEYMAQPE